MAVGTFAEILTVMEAQGGGRGRRQWDQFFRRAGFALDSVTEEQAYAARQAWSDFGKGRSPAKLNFGDCFSYALARTLGEPLLFEAADFSRTDVSSAI